MRWLARKKSYNRSRILAQAARARKRLRFTKAIGLYRQVLEVEPENADLHRRVAPLLARTKQPDEAWASYTRAVAGFVEKGFLEQAIGVYREASHHLPRKVEVWGALAALQLKRQRRADAVEVLLEGRRHFRGRRHHSEAVRLLLEVRKIDPHHFEASLDLAGLLARSGGRGHALRLLDQLLPRAHSRQLRRIRGKQLRISPTPANLWRWIRALFGRR